MFIVVQKKLLAHNLYQLISSYLFLKLSNLVVWDLLISTLKGGSPIDITYPFFILNGRVCAKMCITNHEMKIRMTALLKNGLNGFTVTSQ